MCVFIMCASRSLQMCCSQCIFFSDAQPLQQALYRQDTNGSLVPMTSVTGTGSELVFLQCSHNPIAVTICNHSHDAGVKCGGKFSMW